MTSLKKLLVVLTVLVALGGALLMFWIFTREDVAEVSLTDAVAEAAELSGTSGTEISVATTADEVDTAEDLNGSWVINTSEGEFDFENASGSFVGFRIEEVLASFGAVTAVGRTNQIDGSIEVADNALSEATITVQVGGFTTNDSLRDREVLKALEANEFPEATFVLADPVALDVEDIQMGEGFSAQIVGDLTMHGVTNQVTFAVEGQLVDSFIALTGSTQVTFSDYDVEVPSASIVVSVSDNGILEFQALLEKK